MSLFAKLSHSPAQGRPSLARRLAVGTVAVVISGIIAGCAPAATTAPRATSRARSPSCNWPPRARKLSPPQQLWQQRPPSAAPPAAA